MTNDIILVASISELKNTIKKIRKHQKEIINALNIKDKPSDDIEGFIDLRFIFLNEICNKKAYKIKNNK